MGPVGGRGAGGPSLGGAVLGAAWCGVWGTSWIWLAEMTGGWAPPPAVPVLVGATVGALWPARWVHGGRAVLWSAAIPGLAAMAVLGTVRADHPAPTWVFGGLAAVALVPARRAVAVWALARALEPLSRGEPRSARRRLARLAGLGVVLPDGVMGAVRYNLGAVAFGEGRLEDAARWWEDRGGRGGAARQVRLSLALLDVRAGRHGVAERRIRQAVDEGRGAVRREADGVRLWLTLRRDGPDAARRLGEQLVGPQATGLTRGLVAWLRWRAGDAEGARSLLSSETTRHLMATGLGRAVDEVGEVLGWAALADADADPDADPS